MRFLSQQSLVGISEASHILGVSGAALRQWTDEGKLRAFITPGGHRRYSRAELRKFMGSHQRVLGVKDLAAVLEDTTRLHRDIARAYIATTARYNNKLSRESRAHLGKLSRCLLKLIIRYITEPANRQEIIGLAHDTGNDLGAALARLEFTLTDSVEAFILHRNPIMNATTHLMGKGETLNKRVVEAIPQVDQVMDEALVSLIAAHQHYRGGFQGNQKEATPGDINLTPALRHHQPGR